MLPDTGYEDGAEQSGSSTLQPPGWGLQPNDLWVPGYFTYIHVEL